MAAVWLEAALSAFWANALVTLTVVWLAVLPVSDDVGANPIIGYWGVIVALVGISQALVGIWLDHRYDRRIWRALPWLPLFPLVYWMLLAAAATRGVLVGALRRPRGNVTWHIDRTASNGDAG